MSLVCDSCIWQMISKDIRDKKAKLQELIDEKDSLTGEHQELTKQRAKLDLNIKDLQQELEGDSSGKVSKVQWNIVLYSFTISQFNLENPRNICVKLQLSMNVA